MTRFAITMIVSALLTLFAERASADGRRVALVVGVSAYQNVAKLPNPANDASAVAAMFKTAGFDAVYAYNDINYLEFKRAIRTFQQAASGADMAVIFYAGHGIEINDKNYLLPADASLLDERDVEDEAITLDRLIASLEGAKQLRLVILDACRDNPFANRMSKRVATRAISSGLGRIEPQQVDPNANLLIAFAAKAKSVAHDGSDSHSPFTTALLTNLTAPGLDIRLVFGRVRDDVLKATGSRQEPFVYGSLGGGNIALVPVRAETASSALMANTHGSAELPKAEAERNRLEAAARQREEAERIKAAESARLAEIAQRRKAAEERAAALATERATLEAEILKRKRESDEAARAMAASHAEREAKYKARLQALKDQQREEAEKAADAARADEERERVKDSQIAAPQREAEERRRAVESGRQKADGETGAQAKAADKAKFADDKRREAIAAEAERRRAQAAAADLKAERMAAARRRQAIEEQRRENEEIAAHRKAEAAARRSAEQAAVAAERRRHAAAAARETARAANPPRPRPAIMHDEVRPYVSTSRSSEGGGPQIMGIGSPLRMLPFFGSN